jgi:RNA polymerase sigma-70 factor, ECF subfamily
MNAPTEADFQAAIRARSGWWYSACLRITRNPQLAEDALQDAMLSAWKNRSQFQHNAKLETWIHSIAINSALTLIRKQVPVADDALCEEIEDHSASAEEAQKQAELGSALDGALRKLTDVERMCFVLKHLEDWKVNEIAQALGKNVNAVKQSLFRGVRKLRTELPMLAKEVQ